MDFSKLEVDLLVVKKITGKLPSADCVNGKWSHLNDLELADPNWHRTGTINIMVGIRYFHKLLLAERRIGGPGEPVGWETMFGWAIGGECPEQARSTIISHHVRLEPIQKQLRKFREIEEPPRKRILRKEEKICEDNFQHYYYKRLVNGKFMVSVPFNTKQQWDEKVPESVETRWQEIKEDLKLLPQFQIPRRILVDGAEKVELCGFADSSEVAFGGNVYLRSIYPHGTVEVRFVTSKTRVGPVRQVTLPRLELNAAVCVVELITRVKESLKLELELRLWSDSTIILKWIQSSQRRWKTYVANRVATIQELTPIEAWKHVAGKENPADLVSRGCTVAELINSKLWWRGPKWLSEPMLPTFPEPQQQNEVDLEERKVEIKRYTAYYLRYLKFKVTGEGQKGPLTPSELETAMLVWVRKVQQQHFAPKLESLRKYGKVQRSSKMRDLFPFVDSKGVLRLSGRLKNAKLPEKMKHQCILPGGSHLVSVIMDHHHQSTFHGGFQLTWATIQAEYWVLGGRDKVRFFVRSCVRCRRFRAKVAEQLMGDLPSARVTPSRCFQQTGVDYAGPFGFKNPIGREPKTYKGYLWLFVCLATKAIHLEADSSLSTESFLAALRRFVGRRGLCSHIYSDCGTNFVGADKELRTIVMDARRKDALAKELSDKGITWHFNPPSAPH